MKRYYSIVVSLEAKPEMNVDSVQYSPSRSRILQKNCEAVDGPWGGKSLLY